jgi:hypothetical protein
MGSLRGKELIVKKWTDAYWTIVFIDDEIMVKKFANNSEATEFIENMVENYGIDPAIHAAVIKADEKTSDRLSITTQTTTRVSLGNRRG